MLAWLLDKIPSPTCQHSVDRSNSSAGGYLSLVKYCCTFLSKPEHKQHSASLCMASHNSWKVSWGGPYVRFIPNCGWWKECCFICTLA